MLASTNFRSIPQRFGFQRRLDWFVGFGVALLLAACANEPDAEPAPEPAPESPAPPGIVGRLVDAANWNIGGEFVVNLYCRDPEEGLRIIEVVPNPSEFESLRVDGIDPEQTRLSKRVHARSCSNWSRV